MKQIFLLACALLMLVLPAATPADYQLLGSHGKPDSVSQPDTAMTSDIGLALAGMSGEARAVLKPYERLVRDRGAVHASFKAIACERQTIASIAFLSTVKNTQIHIQDILSGASLCCRAPPAFSKL